MCFGHGQTQLFHKMLPLNTSMLSTFYRRFYKESHCYRFVLSSDCSHVLSNGYSCLQWDLLVNTIYLWQNLWQKVIPRIYLWQKFLHTWKVNSNYGFDIGSTFYKYGWCFFIGFLCKSFGLRFGLSWFGYSCLQWDLQRNPKR